MTTEAERLANELDDEFVGGRISNHNGRKAAALLRSQAAEIERLKSLHAGCIKNIETLMQEATDAAAEIERKDALLRQALEALDSVMTMPNTDIPADTQERIVRCSHALKTIAAIKTHLGEQA